MEGLGNGQPFALSGGFVPPIRGRPQLNLTRLDFRLFEASRTSGRRRAAFSAPAVTPGAVAAQLRGGQRPAVGDSGRH